MYRNCPRAHFPFRCRDVNVEAIDDHLAMIKEQDDHITKLNAKIAEHELENEKFKFARSMLYNGRRSDIKDGIGFQQGSNVKLNAPKKLCRRRTIITSGQKRN